MDKLRKELSGAFQSHPDEMRQILLDLLNRPPSSPTAGHARRPGRGGSLQCARCRRHKNGGKNPCELDDPSGPCIPCARANLTAEQCGPRTWPNGKTQEEMEELQSRRRATQWTNRVSTQPEIDVSRMGIRSPDSYGLQNDLSPDVLNRDRPVHGLDRQILVSSSTGAGGNAATTPEMAPLGMQNVLLVPNNPAFPPFGGPHGPALQVYRQAHEHLQLPASVSNSLFTGGIIDESYFVVEDFRHFLASRFPNLTENRVEQIAQQFAQFMISENETVQPPAAWGSPYPGYHFG